MELALCLPMLVLLMIGCADFARVFYTSIELNNAARAGAQYGASNLARSGDTPGMQNAATGAAFDLTPVSAVASRTCQCFDDSGGPGAVIACATGVCTSGHRVITVTVTASKTFTPLTNYAGIFNPVELTRTSTLRVSE